MPASSPPPSGADSPPKPGQPDQDRHRRGAPAILQLCHPLLLPHRAAGASWGRLAHRSGPGPGPAAYSASKRRSTSRAACRRWNRRRTASASSLSPRCCVDTAWGPRSSRRARQGRTTGPSASTAGRTAQTRSRPGTSRARGRDCGPLSPRPPRPPVNLSTRQRAGRRDCFLPPFSWGRERAFRSWGFVLAMKPPSPSAPDPLPGGNGSPFVGRRCL